MNKKIVKSTFFNLIMGLHLQGIDIDTYKCCESKIKIILKKINYLRFMKNKTIFTCSKKI